MPDGYGGRQGCSALCEAVSKEGVDAAYSETVPSISHILDAVGSQDVSGERTDAGEDAGVFSNAGGIFSHGDITDVMGAIFNAPMRADGVGCDSCRERLGGDVIGGLVGLRFPQTGFRAAVYPLTGHPDHAVQQVLPGGIEDLGPEGEDLDRADFLTTAMAIAGIECGSFCKRT